MYVCMYVCIYSKYMISTIKPDGGRSTSFSMSSRNIIFTGKRRTPICMYVGMYDVCMYVCMYV